MGSSILITRPTNSVPCGRPATPSSRTRESSLSWTHRHPRPSGRVQPPSKGGQKKKGTVVSWEFFMCFWRAGCLAGSLAGQLESPSRRTTEPPNHRTAEPPNRRTTEPPNRRIAFYHFFCTLSGNYRGDQSSFRARLVLIFCDFATSLFRV